MPVTAKLSRKFYEQLGDEIANELVEWFNAVDSDYKSDLKELNELNWNRFRTELRNELDQQWAKTRVELDQHSAKLEILDQRSTSLQAALDQQSSRLTSIEIKFSDLRAELLKWMFLFWVGTLVPLGGLMVALTPPR